MLFVMVKAELSVGVINEAPRHGVVEVYLHHS
jgi:hypothetical protein